MKDLRIITNVEVANMVIVDNSVYSFAYQLDNGIPIIPFYDDPKDEELCHLIFYIENLVEVDDMRVANQRAFELRSLGLEEEDIDESQIPGEDDLDQLNNYGKDEDLLSSSALDKLLVMDSSLGSGSQGVSCDLSGTINLKTATAEWILLQQN